MDTSKDGKYLSVIKTPMIFNAFSVITIGGIVAATGWAYPSGSSLIWFGIGWVAAMTVWVNWQAKVDPRAMMYGPREYIRESELDHERKLKITERGTGAN